MGWGENQVCLARSLGYCGVHPTSARLVVAGLWLLVLPKNTTHHPRRRACKLPSLQAWHYQACKLGVLAGLGGVGRGWAGRGGSVSVLSFNTGTYCFLPPFVFWHWHVLLGVVSNSVLFCSFPSTKVHAMSLLSAECWLKALHTVAIVWCVCILLLHVSKATVGWS